MKLEPSPEDQANFDAWASQVGSDVVELARKFCWPLTCVRIKGNKGHYLVTQISDGRGGEGPVPGMLTVTLRHLVDSYLPGVGVMGVNPDEVDRCGCGITDLMMIPGSEVRGLLEEHVQARQARRSATDAKTTEDCAAWEARTWAALQAAIRRSMAGRN